MIKYRRYFIGTEVEISARLVVLSSLPFVLDSQFFLATQTSWYLLRQLPQEDASQPHCGDIARRRESDLYRSQTVRPLLTYISLYIVS